jgi:hypothetical protein
VFNHVTLAEDSVLGKTKFKGMQKQFIKSDFHQAWSRPKFGSSMQMIICNHKILESSWVAAQFAASQEGISSVSM